MNEQLKTNYWMMERRRREMLRRADILNKIENVRRLVKAGFDFESDPKLKREYLMILTEFGPGVFVFEDDAGKILTKEENQT